VPDWLEALSWMNNNLPHSSVVFTWWDYGYWITVNTGIATLSDNGTGNTTAIQDIATGFMLNESLAVQLMRQERITHVVIFISYNNRGLCGSGGPPFCGYGDDSKWYWMVRIGNKTSINTPMGVASVSFRQIITDPSTGASEYHRLVTIDNKTTDERITTSVGTKPNTVQIPTSNTVLGLLMRSSYPGGRPNGWNDTGPVAPHFFVQDFASSSSYVLVYSVRYPDQPSMTTQLTPAIVRPTGGNTTITGTLTSPKGRLVDTTKIPVILEYRPGTGGNWIFIANVNATAGHFTYNWTKLPTEQPYILVRARWQGDPAQLLDIAVTTPQPLTFM
jgi:hypothetical protein